MWDEKMSCAWAAAAACGHQLEAHREQDVFDTIHSGILSVEVKQKGKRGTMWAMQSEPTSFLGRHEEQMHRIEREDGHGHQEEPALKTQRMQLRDKNVSLHTSRLLPSGEEAALFAPVCVSWAVRKGRGVGSWPDFLTDDRSSLTSILRQCSYRAHSFNDMQLLLL